jgi:hypothetical protein
MKKPLTENIWLMGALTMIPLVGGFAGYRYWMRKRAKSIWLQMPPEDLYFTLMDVEAPPDKIFTAAEHDEMATILAAKDAPFWHVNYVKASSPPDQVPLLPELPSEEEPATDDPPEET